MQLSEIIEYLAHGELSNMFIGDNEEGIVRQKHLPQLISNINLGMISLHRKFPVLYKQIIVQQYEHISDYILDKAYSESNSQSTKLYKYIKDINSLHPFNNDIIKIDRVMSEDYTEFPLNVQNNPYSLFTPSYNLVQVPYPLNDNIFYVEYQAFPEKIPLTTTDTANYMVELPEPLLESLIAFVNYKLYTKTGLEKPEATTYYQKYEAECKQVLDSGLFNPDSHENERLEKNGWV